MKISNLVILVLLVVPFSFIKPKPGISSLRAIPEKFETSRTVAQNIILKSTDGGESWQDLSAGLHEAVEEVELQKESFIAGENGIDLRVGNAIYHNETNSSSSSWNKETFPNEQSSIAPGKKGVYAFNSQGKFLQNSNGTKVWSPVYTNFRASAIRTIFETTTGKVFIGSDYGLFRSDNGGKSWKQVQSTGWTIKMVESNGILMATNQGGIIRSADDGETWENVLSEGGVGIDIQPIKGGFAAINFNTQSETRRIRITYDGGKTWQPIDAGIPGDLRTASIIQSGESFFCGHPNGIYRSSDKGKTWKLVLPSVGDKVFNLFVSGDTIYAIPFAGGC